MEKRVWTARSRGGIDRDAPVGPRPEVGASSLYVSLDELVAALDLGDVVSRAIEIESEFSRERVRAVTVIRSRGRARRSARAEACRSSTRSRSTARNGRYRSDTSCSLPWARAPTAKSGKRQYRRRRRHDVGTILARRYVRDGEPWLAGCTFGVRGYGGNFAKKSS